MSEMLDRIEYAMVDSIKADGDVFSRYDGAGLMTLDGQFDIRGLARAVIEAMREPTARMISEGESAASIGLRKPTDDEGVPRVWRYMIDAALKD